MFWSIIHEQVSSDSDQNHSMKKHKVHEGWHRAEAMCRELRHYSRKGNRLKKEKAIQTLMGYYKVISKCKGHGCNFTWAASRAYK